MRSVKKSALVEFTPAQLFSLVDQVEDYAAFLPWCDKTVVHERHDDGLTAALHINFHGLQHSFSTRNTYSNQQQRIQIALVDGPFKQLEGFWQFTPLGTQACKIEFELDYEFSSRLFEPVMGPMFKILSNTMVDAFIKRAQQVYAAPK